MTESSESFSDHDKELKRRFDLFNRKLHLMRDGLNGPNLWKLAVDAAGASHQLWLAKTRIQQPDYWKSVSADGHILFHALGHSERGETVQIQPDNASKILVLANSDPDVHDRLKLFCGYASAGKPQPHSDETVFILDQQLKDWTHDVLVNGKGRPRSKKQGIRKTAIRHEAIAFTVQRLYDFGLDIYKNEATHSTVNACDAVSEVSGTALNQAMIEAETVRDIFYASSYSKIEKR